MGVTKTSPTVARTVQSTLQAAHARVPSHRFYPAQHALSNLRVIPGSTVLSISTRTPASLDKQKQKLVVNYFLLKSPKHSNFSLMRIEKVARHASRDPHGFLLDFHKKNIVHNRAPEDARESISWGETNLQRTTYACLPAPCSLNQSKTYLKRIGPPMFRTALRLPFTRRSLLLTASPCDPSRTCPSSSPSWAPGAAAVCHRSFFLRNPRAFSTWIPSCARCSKTIHRSLRRSAWSTCPPPRACRPRRPYPRRAAGSTIPSPQKVPSAGWGTS